MTRDYDEQNELYKLLNAKEKEVETRRNKRAIKTLLFFSVIYFLVFYLRYDPKGLEIIATFLVAIFVGGIHFWLNAIIFSQLCGQSEAENKMLDDIRAKIRELD